MTFMLHSFYLSLPLARAMNHTVHTVLLLCLPSATCCLCCCSSSCCCCCTFSKLFSILSFAITDTSPPSSLPLFLHPRSLTQTFILSRNLILFRFASRFVFICVPRRSFCPLCSSSSSPFLLHSILFYTL